MNCYICSRFDEVADMGWRACQVCSKPTCPKCLGSPFKDNKIHICKNCYIDPSLQKGWAMIEDTTLNRVVNILRDVKFPEFTFGAERNARGEYFLQGKYKEADTVTGKIEWQYTRKWLLSPEMTRSEIVQTAFKCVLTSMEHRTREWFTYRGKSVFGPHFDVDALYAICLGAENYDGRPAKA